ncbi:MAG: NAD(P)/FAD-dependent oxidoreductase [Dehalococcoidia bacterium]|nr:MAG: NAD(P)/FAD-dependent oxidoreductase [Dehalococcoidia bacterium]
MANEYDVIIIGTGPNGLEIGAYLSKAGQKVLLLEKRYEAGGGLATEQITLPDYFHNTHAIFHMMVDYAPVYQDFNLEEQYDVRHIVPELQWAMPLPNGKCICVYRDVEKTCASIAKFSQKDADAYRGMYHECDELMKAIVGPQTFVKPEPAPLMAARAEASELGRKLTAFSEMTPDEFIKDTFENDHVRTLMLYTCCHWGLDYSQSGVGYLIPLYFNRMSNYRLTAGGSHRVSNALLKAIFENQGQIRTSAQIKRIIVENGTAKGVELDDGTQFMANKAVVSTIDIHQTFLKYVGEDKLDNDFVAMINAWQWEKWSLCDLHLALEEPPHFKAAESNPDVDKAFMYVLGYESSDELRHEWDMMDTGELPEKAGYIASFPSVHDPYQAPPGRASGLLTQMAPFELKDGGSEKWLNYKFREQIADYQLATLEKYAPNITKDKVLWWNITTPADIQNKFANMVRGSYKQGQYHPLQMGYLRPNQECSHNVTPIKNLFVGGAGVWPGGCVIWGPGYVCANTVAEECGIGKWWKEPEMVTQAREKGYLP